MSSGIAITRRQNIKYNLYKLLEKCSKKQIQRSLMPDHTLLFSNISVLSLLSALLDLASIPLNPYKLINLENSFKQYVSDKETILFSIDDLFDEGWLVKYIDEWGFNSSRNKYEKITNVNNKEKQILEFINLLSKFPYKDIIALIIDVESEDFKNVLAETKADLEWMLERDILRKIDNEYCIYPYSEIWSSYGNIVLSHKLNIWVQNGKTDAYNHWFNIWECLSRCWNPEIEIDDISELYNEAIKYLERECGTWKQEVIISEKWKQIETKDLNRSFNTKFPIDYSNPHSFHERDFEHRREIGNTSSKCHLLFHLCARNYDKVSGELQYRFQQLLQHPIYNILFFQLYATSDKCIIDCLENHNLFMDAYVLLQSKITRALSDKIISQDDILDFCKNIWDIFYNGIILEANQVWIDNMLSWMIFAYGEAHINRKQGSFSYSRISTDLFNPVLNFYKKDILISHTSEVNLVSGIVDRLSKCNNHFRNDYLGILTNLVDNYQSKETEHTKVLFENVFKGFIAWCKQAGNDNMLLSTVSWDLFDKDIWRSIFKNNYDNAKEFFELFKEMKNEVIDKKSSILNEGKLTIIYLNLSTIWLKELKDKLAPAEHRKLEKTWIKDFFDYQKSLDIFSGQNIRLLDSSSVLRNCMQYVSLLSDDNKKCFKQALIDLNSTDVIFWIEHIENDDIVQRCIEIINKTEEQKLLEKIISIPTIQQLADKLCDLCFDLHGRENTKDSYNYSNLLKTYKYVVDYMERIVSKRKEQLQNEYNDWLESSKYRILILEGKREEIISGNNDFYKGLFYLNSDDVKEIRIAREIFEKFYEKKHIPGMINYMIALSRLISHDSDCSNEIDCFTEVVDYLIQNKTFDHTTEKFLYYPLKVFYEQEYSSDFWKVYEITPDSIKSTVYCSSVIIKKFIRENRIELAENLLNDVISKHGLTDDVKKIRHMVESQTLDEQSDFSNEIKPISSNEESIETIKKALCQLHFLSKLKLASVFITENIPTKVISYYETSTLSGLVVIHLLKLLFGAVNKLKEYSYDLLHNEEIAKEDTYNRTLMRIFNMMNSNCIGYQMNDQSQGGTTQYTHKNGENGAGSRDMILFRDNSDVMILEGIRLKSIDKLKILSHIDKLKGYNASDVTLMAIPIYAESSNINKMWTRYKAYLEELKNDNTCGITQVDFEFSWNEAGIEEPVRMVCRTIHNYPSDGLQVAVYHILIDVGHRGDF